MELVVVSHKECWADPTSPSGYATIGGFPFQMQAISELFDQTTLLVPVRTALMPSGTAQLVGHNLQVRPLEEPQGVDWRRKVTLLLWLPRNLPRIWREIHQADAVHAPVPGDIGTIGILVALAQRKPLFVRHCGTWGQPVTAADRFLLWLLERIAGGRNVVMATGGADSLPSRKNLAISWIFATTLTEKEFWAIPVHRPWRSGEPLRMVTVARLLPAKNTEAVIRALAQVRKNYPQTTLDVVGGGPCLEELRKLAADLNLTEAITFHDHLAHEDVMRVLINSHLFVFPTRVKEGFPKAVLEALACGLPVVATAVSVVPHLIGNRNGILLHDTDPASVAEVILQLISDDERFAQMSANAQQTSREYTLERWREMIGRRLRASWGPLRNEESGTAP